MDTANTAEKGSLSESTTNNRCYGCFGAAMNDCPECPFFWGENNEILLHGTSEHVVSSTRK